MKHGLFQNRVNSYFCLSDIIYTTSFVICQHYNVILLTMSSKDSFPQRLVKLRKEKGLSQKELAALSGLSPRMIAHYESQVSHPSLDKIEKIAAALGIKVTDLLSSPESSASTEAGESLSSVNTKTLKQFKKILELSPQDRSTIYRMVDSLLKK